MPTFHLHPARPLHVWLSGLATCLMAAFAILILIGRPLRLAADDPPPTPATPDPGPPVLPPEQQLPSDNDRDGDGIDNAWEEMFFHDPDNPADAGADFDSDGLTALQEFTVWNRPDNTDHAFGNPLGKWVSEAVPLPSEASGWVRPVALNNRGGILARVYIADPEYRRTAMLLGSDGQWREIMRGATPEGAHLWVSDLNDRGEVVGGRSSADGYEYEPFIWDAVTGYRPFTFHGEPAEAWRINNHGDWVGNVLDPLTGEWKAAHVVGGVNLRPSGDWWPYVWYQDINDFGEAMGSFWTGGVGDQNTFLATGSWLFDTGNPGIPPEFDEATWSWWRGAAMNNWGEYCGAIDLTVQAWYKCPAYFFDGNFRPMRPAHDSWSVVYPEHANDCGLVAGVAYDDSGSGGAFLWRDGVGVLAEDVFPDLGPCSTVRINNRGQVLTMCDGSLFLISPDQDDDGDGLPDDWEFAYGLDPANPYDAFLDPDADGTDNLGEFLLLRNPNFDEEQAFLGGAIPDLRPGIDTDGDGIPNIWEWEHSLDYEDPSDGPADPDHDGHTNLQEYRLDTDPHGLPAYDVTELTSAQPRMDGQGFTYDVRAVPPDDWEVFRLDPATGQSTGFNRTGQPPGWLGDLRVSPGGRVLATADSSTKSLLRWDSPAAPPAVIMPDLAPEEFHPHWYLSASSPDCAWAVLGLFRVDDWTVRPAVLSTGPGPLLRQPALFPLPDGWAFAGSLHVNGQGMVAATLHDPGGKPHAMLWDAARPETQAVPLAPQQIQAANNTWETVVSSTVYGLSEPDAAAGLPARAALLCRTTSGPYLLLGSPEEGFFTVTPLSWPAVFYHQVQGVTPGGRAFGTVWQAGGARTYSVRLKLRPGGVREPWVEFGGACQDIASHQLANDTGDLAGSVWLPGFTGGIQSATLWTIGRSAPLADLCPEARGATFSSVTAIDDSGRLLVYGARADGTPTSFLLDPARDTDGDGMRDAFENRHGFRAYDSSDGAEDSDQDGLPNAREAFLGTDPLARDSDADGMNDGWETEWGFNPLDRADATGDPDGDHVSNLRESQIGTPPAGTFRLEEHDASLGDWTPLVPGADGSLLLINNSAFYNAMPQPGGGLELLPDPAGSGALISPEDIALWNPVPYRLLPLAWNGGFHAWTWDAEGRPVSLAVLPGSGVSAEELSWLNPASGETQACWPSGRGSVFGNWQLLESWDPWTGAAQPLLLAPDGSYFSDRLIPLPQTAAQGNPCTVTWLAADENGRAWGVATDPATGGSLLLRAAPAAQQPGSRTIDLEAPFPADLLTGWSTTILTSPSGRCLITGIARPSDAGTRPCFATFDPAGGTFQVIDLRRPAGETTLGISDRGEVLTNHCLHTGAASLLLGRLWAVPADARPAARLEQLGYSSFSPAFFDSAGNILASAVNPAGSRILLRISPAQDQDADGLPDDWETGALRGFQERGEITDSQGNPLPQTVAEYGPDDDLDGDGYTAREEADAGMTDGDRTDGMARDELPFVEPTLWWRCAAAHRSKLFAFPELTDPLPDKPGYYLKKTYSASDHRNRSDGRVSKWDYSETWSADRFTRQESSVPPALEVVGEWFSLDYWDTITETLAPPIRDPDHHEDGGQNTYTMNNSQLTATLDWCQKTVLEDPYDTAMLREDAAAALASNWAGALAGPWTKHPSLQVSTHLNSSEESLDTSCANYAFEPPDAAPNPFRLAVCELRRSIQPNNPQEYLAPPADNPEILIRQQHIAARPPSNRAAPVGGVHELPPPPDNRDVLVFGIAPRLTLTAPATAEEAWDPPPPDAADIDIQPVSDASSLSWCTPANQYTWEPLATEFRVPLRLEIVSGDANSVRLWERYQAAGQDRWRRVTLPLNIDPSSSLGQNRHLLVEGLTPGLPVFRISMVTRSGLRLAARASVAIPLPPITIEFMKPCVAGWTDADKLPEKQVISFDDVTRVLITIGRHFESLTNVLEFAAFRKIKLKTNGTLPDGVDIELSTHNTSVVSTGVHTELRIELPRADLKNSGLLWAIEHDATDEIAWFDLVKDERSTLLDSYAWEAANSRIPERDKRGRAYSGASVSDNGDRPLDKTFLVCGGAQLLSAEFAGVVSQKRQIADQADSFYISGHGEYGSGTLLTDPQGVEPRFGPADAKWDKDMNTVIVAGCSIFGIKTGTFRLDSMHWKQRNFYVDHYGSSDPSPGEAWEGVMPKVKLGYCFTAPTDDQGSVDIAKKYQILVNSGTDPIAAWGQANLGTKGGNACAIDCRMSPHEYWYIEVDAGGTERWTRTIKTAAGW